MLVVRYSLFVVCCSLIVVLLFVICWLLFGVECACCSLFVVCRVFCLLAFDRWLLVVGCWFWGVCCYLLVGGCCLRDVRC